MNKGIEPIVEREIGELFFSENDAEDLQEEQIASEQSYRFSTEEKLEEDYFNYNSSKDYNGARGLSMANIVSKIATSHNESYVEWINVHRKNWEERMRRMNSIKPSQIIIGKTPVFSSQ